MDGVARSELAFGASGPDERRVRAAAALDAFAAREATLKAFAAADTAAARGALARAEGPLAGLLFAAKDVFTSADFPTCYGGAGRADPPGRDAWCVARARALGAAFLGKTACPPFGVAGPVATVNPHDPARTPGGSSSGSAAAVAAGLVDFAFGSQTAGSTIRPAAYCGITGFKPTFGLLPVEGLRPLAPTLDHVGILAPRPRDVWYVVSALLGPAPEALRARMPARLVAIRLPAEARIDPAYGAAFAALAGRLASAGVPVEEIDLPVPWADFAGLHQRICYWEAARHLALGAEATPEARTFYAPHLARDAESYAEACARAAQLRGSFEGLARACDAILLPAAQGPAPRHEDGTGDAVPNRFLTLMGGPVVTIPFARTEGGLPLGLQLAAGPGRDRALLAVAQAILDPGCL